MGMCKPSGGIIAAKGNRVPRENDKPNSRMDVYEKNGKLKSSTWYDAEGRAYYSRDYTDHRNPKKHPVVPHDHKWDWTEDPPRQEWIVPDYLAQC